MTKLRVLSNAGDHTEAVRIEKGVPLPRAHRSSKYPWRQMEVGDSFFAAGVLRSSLRQQAYAVGRKIGRKFAVRQVEGGTRVWRVE
jgi:hypothetical protein